MAGSDQSVNLSGMLSQMNNAIGDMGEKNGEILGNVVANANMPTPDPNDPQSMYQYAEWARRNGKAQEAMTMQMQAREAEKKQKDEALTKAKAGLTSKYHQAVKTGVGEQEAYDNLIQFGIDQGQEVTPSIDQIDAGERGRQDQEYQMAQAEKLKRRENAQQMAIGAMTGKTEVEITKSIEDAPEEFRDIYQTVGQRELQFQEAVAKSASRKEDIKTPVDTKSITNAIGSIDNKKLAKRFTAELAELEGTKSNYWDKKKGQWKSTESKRAWEREVSKLHRSSWDAVTREVINEEDRALAKEEDFQRALGRARSAKVTETEIENYTDAVADDDGTWNVGGYGEISRQDAIAGVIAEREEGLREAYDRVERVAVEGYTIGDIIDGYRYIGGPLEEEASYEEVKEEDK